LESVNSLTSDIKAGEGCWRDRWWLKHKYTRLYSEKISPAEVDRAMGRVFGVFNLDWKDRTPQHPIYGSLLAEGLLPLQNLLSLGQALLELDNAPRLGLPIDDLKQPTSYESTRLEIQFAAWLKKLGHRIEFRPPLPNGKVSDFVAHLGDQHVYFEIKRLQKPQSELSLDELSQLLQSSILNLIETSSHPDVKGKGYNVEVDEGLVNLLGINSDADRAIIEGIGQQILNEISDRANKGQPLDFVIPSIARVEIGNLGDRKSGISWPMLSSHAELKRIVRGHFVDSIEQLHPKHPGMVVIGISGEVDPEMTRVVLEALLARLGPKATHVSAVIFFPVMYSIPEPWALFAPFVVHNRFAKTSASDLRALEDLKPLLNVRLQTPAGRESG
jgi:hypothetical protein